MSIAGQAPEPGQSGATLNKNSTPGQSIGFARQTNTGFASFTITSGSTTGVNANIDIYDNTIPVASRGAQNLKSWNDTIIWQYFNIFIDNDNDFNYQIGTGTSLSSEQKLVHITSQQPMITPVSGHSATVTFQFRNTGASSHTVYFYQKAKYIITG